MPNFEQEPTAPEIPEEERKAREALTEYMTGSGEEPLDVKLEEMGLNREEKERVQTEMTKLLTAGLKDLVKFSKDRERLVGE